MTFRHKVIASVGAAALGLTASVPANAQNQEPSPSRGEIARLVREAMPPVLKSDLPGVVDNLLNVELGKPLTETFDATRAVSAVFGRLPRSFAPDCLRRATPVGEPDQGDCVVSNGQEGGNGAYTRLSYSKNLGAGNIRFLKRGPAQDLDPAKLSPVKMPDGDAHARAREFLVAALGLPDSELLMPPAGVPLPVRHLTIGFDKDAAVAPIVVQKTVHLPRALKLPTPIQGPGNQQLTHVAGPGMATVALDDSGVVGAAVSDWHALQRDPNMSTRNTKAVDELIDEIADDIHDEGGGPIASMRFQIVLGSDFRGAHGLLLPAVKVFVSPVARDPTEDQQRQMAGRTTAGMVREYALVKRFEADVQER
jgi:hypothetical protein